MVYQLFVLSVFFLFVSVINAFTDVIINRPSNSEFGGCVSVNGDGTQIIITDYNFNSGAGAFYVYNFNTSTSVYSSSSTYTQSGTYNLGYGCSMSGDGNYLIVGVDNPGSGYIYRNLGNGVWSEVFATSNPSYPQNVGIDYAGLTAIGCVSGQTYVYTRNPTTNVWSQTYGPLTASAGNPCNYAYGGGGNGLSGDGNTIVVGDPTYNSNAGIAFVYKLSGGIWGSTEIPIPAEAIGASSFGYTTCTNYDGSVLAVGAINDNSQNGALYIYTNGVLDAKLTVSTSGAQLGGSCAFNRYGNVVVVGTKVNSAYAFVNNGSSWVETTLSLGLNGEGYTVGINDAGTVIASGALNSNSAVIWQNVANGAPATVFPSASPTTAPSLRPTKSPSKSPTKSPSKQPTNLPSTSPTHHLK